MNDRCVRLSSHVRFRRVGAIIPAFHASNGPVVLNGNAQSEVPSPQDREEVLIALALEKAADLRPAFLDAECAGDLALRQRLESFFAVRDLQNYEARRK